MRTIDADVLIIGSGAGGGAAAAVLASAGKRVVIVEKGGHFPAVFFNQREWDMSAALYAEGGARSTVDGAIPVRGGECVGGGTTVNVALCFDPVRVVWDEWRASHGLTGFSFDGTAKDYGVDGLNLARSLAAVRARVNVHTPEDREINKNNQTFLAGCAAYGIRAKRFELNMRGCIGCGFCTAGCAYDAKQGTMITFIRDAVAAGASLVHHCRIDSILWDETGVSKKAVGAVGVIEETRKGSLPNAAAVLPGPVQFNAKLVIVAAGAVESPALLARSGHPDPHDNIGHGLVVHPSFPMIGRMGHEIAGFRGIEGSAYSDHFFESDRFYFECLFGHPLYGSMMVPDVGPAHFDRMREFRTDAGFGVMLIDRSAKANRVEWDSSERRAIIHYRLTNADRERLRRAAKIGVEVMFAAGAHEVMFPSEESIGPLVTPTFRTKDDAKYCAELTFAPHTTTLTSAHPQATLKMGEDVTSAMLNSRGESHFVKNLVVCDSSSFPTSCGANPMISIMTLANYQATRILAEWARYA